jgi:hypothetical protein
MQTYKRQATKISNYQRGAWHVTRLILSQNVSQHHKDKFCTADEVVKSEKSGN